MNNNIRHVRGGVYRHNFYAALPKDAKDAKKKLSRGILKIITEVAGYRVDVYYTHKGGKFVIYAEYNISMVCIVFSLKPD
jgi:hypothetical protein